ncbi:hypothetical protein FG379_001906 [Cryptosporidium bovis]|uniref:uncharacterized protein n=1 Tax=Cryptosporidium bovis TaxID=310047 RepID=UPI00351A4CC0|nr:hypothetical protein FG379_001906 [Cryptosporidium bovis]
MSNTKISNILIPPSPNWYSTNSLFVENSGKIYAYTTKNSIIIGDISDNKIIGSVYCGIKSKPISLVMLQFSSDQVQISCNCRFKSLLMLSTHIDDKLRIWELRITNDCNDSVLSCSSELILDTIKIKSGTNIIINSNTSNEIVTGDIHGEINILEIISLRNKQSKLNDDIYEKIKYEQKRFKFFTDEITALCITNNGDNNLFVGYRSGRIIIFNKSNGKLLNVFEHNLLVDKPILSLVEYKYNIWIGTSLNDYIFAYNSNKKEISTKKLVNNSYIDNMWTILLILGDKLYVSCNNNEILELDPDNVEKTDIIDNDQVIRKLFISKSKTEHYRTDNQGYSISNTNCHMIFCLKSVKTSNGSLFLMGTTKSNIVFFVNIEIFKFEWMNNTLGGWVDNIISPYGYSHIIYIQTGDGKLIGMDLLNENKRERNQLYDDLGYLGKGERIIKLSINYLYSQYICYLTNLGNLGMLFINPNNIAHYTNLKLKSKFNKTTNIENYYLDWFEFENDVHEDKLIHSCDSEYFDNDDFYEIDGIDNNKKIYNKLLNEKYRHVIILFDKMNGNLSYIILFEKKNDKRNIFETIFGEIDINVHSLSEKKIDKYDVELKDSDNNNDKFSINSSDIIKLDFKYLYFNECHVVKEKNTLYFSSVKMPMNTEINATKDNVNINNKRLIEDGVNLFIYKINFELRSLNNNTSNYKTYSCNGVLENNIQLVQRNFEFFKVGDYILGKEDKVISGTIVLDNRHKSDVYNEIYILLTRNGNLILFLNSTDTNKLDKDNNGNTLKLENIFKEKNKIIKYDYLSMDLIMNSERENYGNRNVEFMIAVLNDMNKTSIFKITCCFEKNILLGENIIIRSNLCHVESLINKYNFKSNLIWFRDTRDFNIEYGNNFRLIIGGQEQILQMVNISNELNEKKKNLVINRNSLLFLTNKNIYQQNNKDCIESLYIMILFKMIIYLDGNEKIVNYDTIYNYLSSNGMLKYIFDFILFLNYNESSIDLIDFHIYCYSKFNHMEGNFKYKIIENISEFKKNDNIAINDYIIEYIAMLNCDFSSNLYIIENYLNKNKNVIEDNNKNALFDSITGVNNNNNINSGNNNNEYILFEWIRYLINLRSKDNTLSSNENVEKHCIIKSYILKLLTDLERKLIDYRDTLNKNTTLISKNENILHEYCILNLFQGRIHKSIEMYCNYNLYQNAFLISNYFFGNNSDITLNIMRRWLNHFVSNELHFQSYKCYIAINEYVKLYKDLYKKITKLISIKGSYENIHQLFSLFKIVGYLNIIINLNKKDNNKITTDNDNSGININTFSINLLDCYFMFYINYYFETEIENIIKNEIKDGGMNECNYDYDKDKCNIKEFISISLSRNNECEEMFSKLRFKCDEISKYISKNLLLYELMFKIFSFLIYSKWKHKGLICVVNLMKKMKVNIDNKDDILLYIKKYNYLPFEDQLLNFTQLKLLKEFILFILNINYDKYEINWMFNLEKIIILSYKELFSNDEELNNNKVMYILIKYLSILFLQNDGLNELINEDSSTKNYKITNKMEKRYQIIRYDLEVICKLLFLRRGEYLDHEFKNTILFLYELLSTKDNLKNCKDNNRIEIIKKSFGIK